MTTEVEAPPPTEEPPTKEESFLTLFLKNLWSANTVTVTVLSIFLAPVLYVLVAREDDVLKV